MRRHFIIIFLSLSCGLRAQKQIPIITCDSSNFTSLPKTDLKINHLPCSFASDPKVLYFTSLKEFNKFYTVKRNDYNSGCFETFRNFDFQKNNMLIIHYELETGFRANLEVRNKDKKYYVLVRVSGKINPLQPMPNPYHKFIALPKSNSAIPPVVYMCQSFN
jgi:hypothetical protein